jgi:hypothetical protein
MKSPLKNTEEEFIEELPAMNTELEQLNAAVRELETVVRHKEDCKLDLGEYDDGSFDLSG